MIFSIAREFVVTSEKELAFLILTFVFIPNKYFIANKTIKLINHHGELRREVMEYSMDTTEEIILNFPWQEVSCH